MEAGTVGEGSAQEDKAPEVAVVPTSTSSSPPASGRVVDCGKGRHTFVGHLVTQVRGARCERCDQCGKRRPWSTHFSHCAVCAATACPACRRAERAATAEEDDWEQLIFSLPRPLLGKTVRFVPHSLFRKYATCCWRSLELAIDDTAGKYSSRRRRQEAFCRLAVAMPYLLLFEPRSASDASPVRNHCAVLTGRLRGAEQGKFGKLIREAMAHEADCAQAARDRPAAQHEQDRRKQLERAEDNAEDGCLRAAAQCLRPSGTLPPGPETTAKVSELYRQEVGMPLPAPPAHRAKRTVASRLRDARGTSGNAALRTRLASPERVMAKAGSGQKSGKRPRSCAAQPRPSPPGKRRRAPAVAGDAQPPSEGSATGKSDPKPPTFVELV